VSVIVEKSTFSPLSDLTRIDLTSESFSAPTNICLTSTFSEFDNTVIVDVNIAGNDPSFANTN